MDRRLFSLGVVVVLCLLLTGPGCFNLGKNAPPTKFYMLHAMNKPEGRPSQAGRMGEAFIGVGPIKIPSYLERPQIVTRGADYEVEIADFANWAEPLKDSCGRVLAESLAGELGTEKVVVFPWTSEVPVDYQVQLEVLRFDGTLGQGVVLDVGWMIYGKPRRGLLVNKHSLIHADTQGPDYGALVQAMSETLGKLGGDIASEIRKLQ
jgi:uncharacterized lipoprotein YmbA